MSRRKANNLSHFFFASANSPFNFSLSFFNLLFSLDKSGQWVFGSTHPVEVEPISSPPEFDAEFLLSSTDFTAAGNWVFRHLIASRRSICPRLKF
jgi:hypothetical protein